MTALDPGGTHERAPRPGPDVVAPVRLLARWDSLLLAHGPKFRTRILPAEHHAAVNRPNGDVLPTFLVDGFVAGTWTYEPGGARSPRSIAGRRSVPTGSATRSKAGSSSR